MDTKQNSVALLSIHPRYAESILEGKKTVEFRKSKFGREVTRVVIYATLPVGAVIGSFEIEEFVESHPNKLWKQFSTVGGIDKNDFDDYYSGRDKGVAIKIKKTRRFAKPLSLGCVDQTHPPQNYYYLSERAVKVAI